MAPSRNGRTAPTGITAMNAQIAAEYARIRAAKRQLTQVCKPEYRADLRAMIYEATERIWRLKRLAQPTSPRRA